MIWYGKDQISFPYLFLFLRLRDAVLLRGKCCVYIR